MEKDEENSRYVLEGSKELTGRLFKVKEGVTPLSVGHQAEHLRDRECCRRGS